MIKSLVYPLLTLLALHMYSSNVFAIAPCNQYDKASETERRRPSAGMTANESFSEGDNDRINYLIAALHSHEGSIREDAERELVRLSLKSPENRQAVITALLKSVDTVEELNGTHSVITESLPYWRSVTSIFARVKATESINILIRCVQCSNGYTGTIGEPPASKALIDIGAPAVPQLSRALLNEPNGYKRVKLALCLGRIGGPKARVTLQRALRTEPEKDVRDRIKFILNEMR